MKSRDTKSSDAILKSVNEHGVELRFANKKTNTWPGWHTPLGKRGFWVGTSQNHKYLGVSPDPQKLELLEF